MRQSLLRRGVLRAGPAMPFEVSGLSRNLACPDYYRCRLKLATQRGDTIRIMLELLNSAGMARLRLSMTATAIAAN